MPNAYFHRLSLELGRHAEAGGVGKAVVLFLIPHSLSGGFHHHLLKARQQLGRALKLPVEKRHHFGKHHEGLISASAMTQLISLGKALCKLCVQFLRGERLYMIM